MSKHYKIRFNCVYALILAFSTFGQIAYLDCTQSLPRKTRKSRKEPYARTTVVSIEKRHFQELEHRLKSGCVSSITTISQLDHSTFLL